MRIIRIKKITTNKRKAKNHTLGFTLVETLVAVSILSISILAAFTAVQSGIQDSTIARDQVTAFYLAQEGMEYIKNVRDENALHSISGLPTNWLHGLSEVNTDACFFGKTCTVDVPLRVATTCSGGYGSCEKIRQDGTSGLFGYTPAWTPTQFKREVQFEKITMAAVSVNWVDDGSGNLNISGGSVSAENNNVGTISTQSISSGDGYIEFKPAETSIGKMVGLTTTSDWHFNKMNYGIYMTQTGRIHVIESGVDAGTDYGSYTSGGTFKIALESGSVNYYYNGGKFHTTSSTVYPVVASVHFLASSGGVNTATFSSGTVNLDQEVFAKIRISWSNRGTAHSFDIKESLFNHQ